jgi:hypothetical protein
MKKKSHLSVEGFKDATGAIVFPGKPGKTGRNIAMTLALTIYTVFFRVLSCLTVHEMNIWRENALGCWKKTLVKT